MTIAEYQARAGHTVRDFRGSADAIRHLCQTCHVQAGAAGWWHDLETGESLIGKRNVPEMLMLIVSEVAEAMEGYRKDKADDHLPHRKMFEVEMADALVRIFDMAEAEGLDLAGAFVEKLAYNASRADHKPEARKVAGGKRF